MIKYYECWYLCLLFEAVILCTCGDCFSAFRSCSIVHFAACASDSQILRYILNLLRKTIVMFLQGWKTLFWQQLFDSWFCEKSKIIEWLWLILSVILLCYVSTAAGSIWCIGEIKHGMFDSISQLILKFVGTYWVVADRTTNNKFWNFFWGIYDLFCQKIEPKVIISTVFSFYVPFNPEPTFIPKLFLRYG